jgi:hypothetical protein
MKKKSLIHKTFLLALLPIMLIIVSCENGKVDQLKPVNELSKSLKENLVKLNNISLQTIDSEKKT